jgi:hypothetical protein
VLAISRLQELESRWRAVDAPILDNLRAGLTVAAMDEITAPLGLRLPAEARTWWGWHDGVPSGSVRLRGERTVGPIWPYQPLAEAVEECLKFRALSDEFEAAGEPRWFSSSWLPISSEFPEAVLVCDCGVGQSEPTPIRRVTPPEGQEPPGPICASFDELVKRWIEALDCGLWARAQSRWAHRPENLPAGWPINGVA